MTLRVAGVVVFIIYLRKNLPLRKYFKIFRVKQKIIKLRVVRLGETVPYVMISWRTIVEF